MLLEEDTNPRPGDGMDGGSWVRKGNGSGRRFLSSSGMSCIGNLTRGSPALPWRTPGNSTTGRRWLRCFETSLIGKRLPSKAAPELLRGSTGKSLLRNSRTCSTHLNYSPNTPAGSNINSYGPVNLIFNAVQSAKSLIKYTGTSTLRNDYFAFVGLKLVVRSIPLVVTELGRWVVSGNIGTHTVKLVDTSGTGVITESELHSLANLRGIPTEINVEVHLRQIRAEWDAFYRMYPVASKQQILSKATEIDNIFGHLFDPPIR